MDLNDFRQQIANLKKMGSVRDLIARMPGLNYISINSGMLDVDRELSHLQGILDSMTQQERSYPVLMTVPSRCLRIAAGAGVEPSEVSKLFTRFKAMRAILSGIERGKRRIV